MSATTFQDSAGRDWSLRITHQAIRDVRDQVGFAFGTSLSNGTFLDMLGDYDTLGRVVWCLVRDQAKGRDIDEASFLDAFTGDALHDAAMALSEAFALFCPSQDRMMLNAFLNNWEKMTKERIKLVERMMASSTGGLKASNSEQYAESIPGL